MDAVYNSECNLSVVERLFVGLSGTVKLDSNADRIANYRIWHLPKDSDAYEDFVDIEMIDSVRGVCCAPPFSDDC